MKTEFYASKVRNESIAASRLKDYTYGRKGFAHIETDVLEKQTHGSYGKLLFDKRWIDKRREIIQRDNGACVICKKTMNLQVHHRQYHFIKILNEFKAPWDYEPYLLITLCEKCHSKGHSKYKVPNVYI